jgi:TPR repeat protein
MNLNESAQYYRLAADQGDAAAQFNYGLCLPTGEGVSMNWSESAKDFRLAADQGHADAQFKYGNCLATGEGVSMDLTESARHYRLAADQGHADGGKVTADKARETVVSAVPEVVSLVEPGVDLSPEWEDGNAPSNF